MTSVKTIIRTHAEWLLIAAGALLAAAIIWFLVWGVSRLARDIGVSLSSPQRAGAGEKFDLEAAAKLDFRGLK